MVRKKSKKGRNSGDVEVKKETLTQAETDVTRIAGLFTSMQEKGAVWYGREREGITLIEGFQSALLAVRNAQDVVSDRENKEDGKEKEMLAGWAGNGTMDPWLAEDLYQQIQELLSGFKELLEEMYTLQSQARKIVLDKEDDGKEQLEATQLRPVDYLQMMNQELATFEAEYQHIEALLHLISFETSTDELRTLIISWSTSPFLDPVQTRSFLQRHMLSRQLCA